MLERDCNNKNRKIYRYLNLENAIISNQLIEFDVSKILLTNLDGEIENLKKMP